MDEIDTWRADQLLEDGDVSGFHVWVRITKAVKELHEAEPRDLKKTH